MPDKDDEAKDEAQEAVEETEEEEETGEENTGDEETGDETTGDEETGDEETGEEETGDEETGDDETGDDGETGEETGEETGDGESGGDDDGKEKGGEKKAKEEESGAGEEETEQDEDSGKKAAGDDTGGERGTGEGEEEDEGEEDEESKGEEEDGGSKAAEGEGKEETKNEDEKQEENDVDEEEEDEEDEENEDDDSAKKNAHAKPAAEKKAAAVDDDADDEEEPVDPNTPRKRPKKVTRNSKGLSMIEKLTTYVHAPGTFNKRKLMRISTTPEEIASGDFMRALKLPKVFEPATPVLYVIGSLEKAMYSKGLFDEVEADVHLGIARAAANVDAIVVDNGLQTSTGALCGEVRTLPVYSVGVTDGNFPDNVLDTRYNKILSIDELESPRALGKLRLEVVKRLAGHCKVVCLVAGGTKEDCLGEVNGALGQDWPVFCLESAGGFGGFLCKAAAKAKRPKALNPKGKLVRIPRETTPPEVASCMHIALTISIL